MKKTVFEYKGYPVTFENGETGQMINATQMVQSFNDANQDNSNVKSKRISDFFNLRQTENFVFSLHNSLITSQNENLRYKEKPTIRSVNGENLARLYPKCVKVVRGGHNAGTWMHETLALKLAAWLNADFELWIYQRIKELLQTGKTELDERPGFGLIKSIRMIADQLEAHEQDIRSLKEDMSDVKNYVGDIEARLVVQDKNFLSVAAYCSLNSIDCPLDKAQRWGYNCTVLSKKLNKHFYHIHDPRFGKVGVYHTDVLKQIIQ